MLEANVMFYVNYISVNTILKRDTSVLRSIYWRMVKQNSNAIQSSKNALSGSLPYQVSPYTDPIRLPLYCHTDM